MLMKLIIIIALFSNWLEEWIPLFTYSDELLAIILPLIGLIKLVYRKQKVRVFTSIELITFILIGVVCFLSIISTVFSKYDNTHTLQLYTLFGNSKYILIYIGVRIIGSYTSNNIGKFVIKLSYLFSSICLFVFFISLILPFMKVFSYRFGFANISYGFGHPAEFSLCIVLLTILNLYFNATLKYKINYFYLGINLLLLFTAGRLMPIAFSILLIILILSFRYFRRYVLAGLTVSLVCSITFAWGKFTQTFINVQEPRGILIMTSIDIAKRFFPLGSGLGTFGSNASRINYSDIYYEYGFSNIWGLAPWYDVFLADSYWAMVLGEVGFVGAILTLISFSLLIINSYKISKGLIGIIISLPFMYNLINTLIDTTIVANSSLPLMFVAGLLVSLNYKISN